jgi:hypothetical protein
MKSQKTTSSYYEIRLEGELGEMWGAWFEGLKLTRLEGDGTLLSGPLPDQAALHGLLERIRDLNLRLISVTCGDPPLQPADQEEKGEGNENDKRWVE